MTQVAMTTKSVGGNGSQSALQSIQRAHQYCTFWAAGRLLGVDILDVKEINMETNFTPVYHAPEQVRGYVNIRGQIYLILDLKMILGRGQAELLPTSRLVLFKPSVGDAFGVLVDRVGDVVEVDQDSIEDRRRNSQGSMPENAERRGTQDDLVEGVCKLQGVLLVVLNAYRLLKYVEMRKS